jgi:hypothetical protein
MTQMYVSMKLIWKIWQIDHRFLQRRADYDFIRANPPAPAESSYPGAEGYNVPPSHWGRFPEPIDRLMPERYINQSPPPIGGKSISIENLVNFLEAFSTLQQGPHRLEAEVRPPRCSPSALVAASIC